MSAPCRLPNNFGEASLLGIWASGLALSAQYDVRDNNEASWTQVVEMLESMSDVTSEKEQSLYPV